MTYTDRRRPFDQHAQTQVGQPGEAFSSLAQPLVAPLSACPITNRRPRDLPQFQAACEAAPGQPILELEAVATQPGMRIWTGGVFRTVAGVYRDNDGSVELTYSVPNGAMRAWMAGTAPLYRLGAP